MALEVQVDRSRCRGAGVCARRAPASFESDADGRALVKGPPGDPEERLREAALGCPFFAISLVESDD